MNVPDIAPNLDQAPVDDRVIMGQGNLGLEGMEFNNSSDFPGDININELLSDLGVQIDGPASRAEAGQRILNHRERRNNNSRKWMDRLNMVLRFSIPLLILFLAYFAGK